MYSQEFARHFPIAGLSCGDGADRSILRTALAVAKQVHADESASEPASKAATLAQLAAALGAESREFKTIVRLIG
jgi:hypothetical protein